MQKLIDAGFEAYIIGGANRDEILRITPQDYDIFSDASGEEILKIFPQGKVIGGEERQKKILTVMVDGVEVSQYRSNGERTETGKNLIDHLSTCDFRCNAISQNIKGTIIDPFDGAWDITLRKIKAVGCPKNRLNEDKLRALRAVRFQVKYNFMLSPALEKAIKELDITTLPPERTREEILKIIRYKDGMKTMTKLGLFTQIIPEFYENIHLDGGTHHNEPIDEHMFNAQNEACKLTNNRALILGISLHDIGKAETMDGTGEETSFHNHEKVGASMMRRIMERLKFSEKDIKYVTTLISEHMFGPWKDDTITKRGFIRHFKILEDAGISIEDYVLMLYCDNQGNLKNTRKKYGDFIRNNKLHKKYYELKHSKEPFSVKDLEISGKDLIVLGMKPGKKMGELLNEIFEKVMDGELENKRFILMKYCKTVVKK